MYLDKKKKFVIDFIYISLWIAIIYIVLKVLLVYLLPFVIGIIIAHLVQKPALLTSQKIKVKKEICAAVFSVFFYIISVAFIVFILWLIYAQGNKLIDAFKKGEILNINFNNVFNAVTTFFEKFNNNFGNAINKVANETAKELVLKFSNILSNALSSFIKKMPSLFISIAITIVATFYISKDYNKLKKFILGFTSDNICNKVAEIKSVFIECFFKISIGYFWLYLITFFELFFGFMALGISNPLLLALLISFVDILPVLGTGTVLLPWAIVRFMQNDFKTGIGLAILYIVIIIIRNLLEPKIIGSQTGINPIFTLVFIFLGFRIGGIMGMIVIPIVLTVVFTYFRKQIAVEKS